MSQGLNRGPGDQRARPADKLATTLLTCSRQLGNVPIKKGPAKPVGLAGAAREPAHETPGSQAPAWEEQKSMENL